MKLSIENFAKIKRADIELNGITIIAGENDSGKSTVGKALAAMFSGFYNVNERFSSTNFGGGITLSEQV